MSERYTMTGIIRLIEEAKTYGKKGFTKRLFTLETEGKYPQTVPFEVTGDKIALLDDFRIGNKVEVFFNVNAREWNGKYFVNLGAWRIEFADIAGRAEGDAARDFNEEQFNEELEDDVPF